MKKLLLLTITLFALGANAQITFQKKITSSVNANISDGKPTADGGYVLCGYIIIDNIEPGSYLVKLNDDGDTVWTRTFSDSTSLNEGAHCVQQTFDGGYVMTGTASAEAPGFVYVIKTDANGDMLWTWSNFIWDGPGLPTITQTLDSGYILAGYIPPGNYSYITKLDKNGALTWNKALEPDIWYNARDIKSVKQTSDSGFIICGYYNDTGFFSYSDTSSANNIYLVKTNALGDTLWTKRYIPANALPTSASEGADVIQTADSGYIVTGSTKGIDSYWRLFAIKINADGDTLWTKTYSQDSTQCFGNSIDATDDGGYIITGRSDAVPQGGVLLIKINANGDALWTRNFGENEETGLTVRVAKDGGYFIAGCYGPDSTNLSYGYIVKTDSLGHSGCFENNINLAVSSFPVLTSTAITIDSSSIADLNGIAFIVLNALGVDSTICISTGIDEVNNATNGFSLYPDPAVGTLQLAISNRKSSNVKYQLKIFNPLGELCFQSEIQNAQSEIDVSSLAEGIYFLTLNDGKELWTGKFVKE